MMTSLEWFAFVILPATLAVVAIGASRLFDRLHPVPSDPDRNVDQRLQDVSDRMRAFAREISQEDVVARVEERERRSPARPVR
jgi:hypothetical protein